MTFIATQVSDCYSTKRILSGAERLMEKMAQRTDAEPSSGIKIEFVRAEDFEESCFNIVRGSEKATITVKQLFPSGRYVKDEVCSQKFIEELSKGATEADSIQNFVESISEFEAMDRLENEIAEIMRSNVGLEEKYNRLVSEIIPLTESELKTRDMVEQKMVSELKKQNEAFGGKTEDI